MRVTLDNGPAEPTGLRIAGEVDQDHVARLHRRLQDDHARTMQHAWIGALVTRFTNDELRFLADDLSIGEVVELRRLGLLTADEGFDGTKESRERAERNRAGRVVAGGRTDA